MAQNFIVKISVLLCSKAKEISEIHQLEESDGSLKSFKSIKGQPYIHLYSFIL